MYLFVWTDGRVRQFRDNLTVLDHLAVTQGLLHIFRFDHDKESFARLVIDNGRACWVPVQQGRTAISSEAKLHF